MKHKDLIPKMPMSVELTKVDNGYIVRHYSGDKREETVHKTLDEAMGSMIGMMDEKNTDSKHKRMTSDGYIKS